MQVSNLASSFSNEDEFNLLCKYVGFIPIGKFYIDKLVHLSNNVLSITKTSIIGKTTDKKEDRPLYRFCMDKRFHINTSSSVSDIRSAIKRWCLSTIDDEKKRMNDKKINDKKYKYRLHSSSTKNTISIIDKKEKYIGVFVLEPMQHDRVYHALMSIIDSRGTHEDHTAIKKLCSVRTDSETVSYIVNRISPEKEDLIDMDSIL
jgi:hypothetical protein